MTFEGVLLKSQVVNSNFLPSKFVIGRTKQACGDIYRYFYSNIILWKNDIESVVENWFSKLLIVPL